MTRSQGSRLVRELVLDDLTPFVPFTMSKRGKHADFEAKTVTLADELYRLSQPSAGGVRMPPIAARPSRRWRGNSPRRQGAGRNVALDDCHFESLPPKLWHLQPQLVCLGLQLAFHSGPRACIPTGLA